MPSCGCNCYARVTGSSKGRADFEVKKCLEVWLISVYRTSRSNNVNYKMRYSMSIINRMQNIQNPSHSIRSLSRTLFLKIQYVCVCVAVSGIDSSALIPLLSLSTHDLCCLHPYRLPSPPPVCRLPSPLLYQQRKKRRSRKV